MCCVWVLHGVYLCDGDVLGGGELVTNERVPVIVTVVWDDKVCVCGVVPL